MCIHTLETLKVSKKLNISKRKDTSAVTNGNRVQLHVRAVSECYILVE